MLPCKKSGEETKAFDKFRQRCQQEGESVSHGLKGLVAGSGK
jgi:hypothetical protein